MYWVMQRDIFKEDGWKSMVETLERFNLPHSVHSVVPFVGEIMPDVNPTGNVICFGTYSLRHLAKRKNWFPGVFDLEPYDFTIQLQHWGDRMLNADSVVAPFKEIVLNVPMFVRPANDTKYFAGKVFDPDEFHTWKIKVCVLEEDYGTSLTKDTILQACSLKEIYTEHRYWIVDGKIVTKSQYKRGNKIEYKSDVDPMFDEFVCECIAIWQPLRAFVIDVCDTDQGLKIVEINTINSSGFYAGDMQKLVFALEDSFG